MQTTKPDAPQQSSNTSHFNSARRFASLLLLFALLAPYAHARAAAQTQTRERRTSTQTVRPTPTPTPTPPARTQTRATPTPTPAARQTPTPTPSATPTQTPGTQQTPTPTPTPTPSAAPRTLEELRARVREIVSRPEFAASNLAIKVASLDTGRVLLEENAGKWMQPASNMKLYTVAAALDRLGPDYHFITSVYAPARADASGTIRGDLVVYGRGDPSYATRFNAPNDPDYYRAIDDLATRITAAGVRRVEGDLVGDESYFTGGPLPTGWEWDDLQWWYGAEVSALTVNDNSIDLSIKPGARAGDPCRITIGPDTSVVTIVDRTKTSDRGSTRELSVHRPLGQNTIEIRGTMPLDDRGFNASLAVPRPALVFVTMLRTALERRGVVFTGGVRTLDAQARADGNPLPVSSLVEIATRQSPPLSVIAAQTLKPSQNLYAELILRALGKATSANPKQTSEEAGIAAVKEFIPRAGVAPDRLVMLDGSGLSRANLVTAESTLRLLIYMNQHRASVVFREALPVAGLDGTLRNRMKGTPAQNNVRAKTGTLGTATSLSGYLFSAAGERLVFSLMINNPPRDTDPRAGFTDAIAVLLASFTGRS
ncbi:MAG TPA: D-alanyl-D-alanine carboxypeptidase/D-alanyl-D-alanine-endopeptidase [Pyrinomonadaceae bacterium]|nr:D-alanyl-D-alanine carboxypeptidase/D-alanyl-D-alanine-endopeptidase [Pyrinomonadaceae bacterium]